MTNKNTAVEIIALGIIVGTLLCIMFMQLRAHGFTKDAPPTNHEIAILEELKENNVLLSELVGAVGTSTEAIRENNIMLEEIRDAKHLTCVMIRDKSMSELLANKQCVGRMRMPDTIEY